LKHLDLLQLLAAILRGDAESVASAPMHDEAALGALAWVASEQLLSPALYPALVRSHHLDAVRGDFRAYLKSLYDLNVQRNERLGAQADELWDALSAAGVRPLALKGLAGLVCGLYPEKGERLISDIDVQVAKEQLGVARAALVRLGYRPTPAPGATEADYEKTHQEAPLIHPSRAAAVELHRRLLSSPRASRVIAALGHTPDDGVTRSGRTWRVPNPTLWFAHVWLHQMVQDSAYMSGHFHLRQLLEARRLVEGYRDRIDWGALERGAREGGCLGEWGALGVALARLLGTEIPISLRARALGEAWFSRACAQYRWPAIETWLRRGYRRLRRRLPEALRTRLGWSGYGWKGD
jgi:hypothetical protein